MPRFGNEAPAKSLAMHFVWFCNTDRMVWQHGSNTFATHRMVWQCGSNTYATRIEWFVNADRILMQHASNGLAKRIEYFCNTHRIIPHPKRICVRIVKVQSISRMCTACTLQPREPSTSYSNDVEKLNGAPRRREG